MIVPFCQDERLLEDIRAATVTIGRFHLWWLGQSGFLLKCQAGCLLFDPYLSDALTEKYSGTDKPHVRMTGRCVDPARLDMISVVTSSHHHTDHFDAATLGPLVRANPGLTLVLPAANLDLARAKLGDQTPELAGIDDGSSVEISGFRIEGIPAAHDEVERDAAGRCRYLGFAVRFGDWKIYHSGDTRWHPELQRRLIEFAPDVVLVPINGHRPERRVAGNLSGREAAALAKACQARLAIPHHFEMFEFNTEPPDAFVAACVRLRQPHRVLRCGERFTSSDAGLQPRG